MSGGRSAAATITPTNASSILLVRANVWVYINSGSFGGVSALFRSTSTDALAAQITFNGNSNSRTEHVLCYAEAAGSTSSTTFSLRVGPTNASATATFNGSGGSAELGAVIKAHLSVMEILP